MAEIVQIPNAATTAKIRNPLAVLGLGLITLGIYHIFWWYFINREMADYGRANGVDLGDNPVISVWRSRSVRSSSSRRSFRCSARYDGSRGLRTTRLARTTSP